MLKFSGRGILLDIEGTTSSISFVYDVMFPFVRRELDSYFRTHWLEPQLDRNGRFRISDNHEWCEPLLIDACDGIAKDIGQASLTHWCKSQGFDCTKQSNAEACQTIVKTEVLRLMDADIKSTGLKQLQGLIWDAGFKSGEMKAHVYEDVPPALAAWNKAGLDVRIYSSGSVQAQKLFFGHTNAGNLLPLFRGHYDTTTGPKREAASYAAIAAAFALPPQEILFLSDVPAELDAAKKAELQTGLVLRPGNAAVPPDHGPPEIRTFAEVRIG